MALIGEVRLVDRRADDKGRRAVDDGKLDVQQLRALERARDDVGVLEKRPDFIRRVGLVQELHQQVVDVLEFPDDHVSLIPRLGSSPQDPLEARDLDDIGRLDLLRVRVVRRECELRDSPLM